jgi:hypothetical protein
MALMWDKCFIQGLSSFLTVPNTTPNADPEYYTNKHLDKAIRTIDRTLKVFHLELFEKHEIRRGMEIIRSEAGS